MSGSFDPAADSAIVMSAGDAGPAGTGAHAIAILWKTGLFTGNGGLVSLYASATQVRQFSSDGGELFGAGDFSSGYPPDAVAANTWYVAIISKPAGSAHYRIHLWPYAADGSGVMDHGESGSAANHGDGSTITEIRVGLADTRANGLIAVVGIYNFEPTDAQCNTLKSGNLAAWAALGPAELISLQNWNGTDGCTAVVGTSVKTSITGSVGVGANPPGFDFSTSGAEAFDFGTPSSPDNSDGGQVYTFGCEWESSAAGQVLGGRWRRSTFAAGVTCYMLLYRVSDMALLASKTFTAGAGDNDINFDTPVDVAASTRYVSAVLADRYAVTIGGWPFTTAHLSAPADVNGRLATTSADTPIYPSTIHGSGGNFFIGPLFAANSTVVALTPATVDLTPRPVTPVPNMITVDLTPAPISLAARAVTPASSMVTVDLVPAVTAITAIALAQEPEGPNIMAVSPQHATLVANTVATMTFDEDFYEVEVTNVTGDALVYLRFDGVAPVIAAAGTYVILDAKASVKLKPKTSGNTVVKLISAGTPKVSVRGLPSGS